MKMHASFHRSRTGSQRGHALVLTLIVVGTVSSIVGASLLRTTSTQRIAQRSTDYISAEKAVEGAVEYAFGVWKKRITDQDRVLSSNEVALATRPTFTGHEYVIKGTEDYQLQVQAADAYGAPLSGAAFPPMVWVNLRNYPGWRGRAFTYTASAKVRRTIGLSAAPAEAGARRMVQYIQVPLFQAMYFFEHNLEIFFPAEMMVGGLVHTNSKLMISGRSDAPLKFSGNISHVGQYTHTVAPDGGPEWAAVTRASAEASMISPEYTGGGIDAQVSKVDRYEPLGTKPAEVLNPLDANPNNDSFRELIEPPETTAADPSEISKRRLFNKAGIVMKIDGNTVDITTKNGTTLTAAKIADLKKAVMKTATPTLVDRATIYDKRETKNVDVVNVNVAQITSTLNGSGSGFNGVLYVHDVTAATTADTEPRTVRLQKGGVLPDGGLTVVSQNPIYIQGDYNTGTTTTPTSVPANNTGNNDNLSSPVIPGYTRKPSAVIADAVMFLSNAWNDANASAAVASRVASNTTYNTAVLAGFLPSLYDPDGPTGPKAAYGYSGGANNFPRFLETWNGKTCTYYGSMVELFESKTFTGKWTTGDIYVPPKRRWNFDNEFMKTPPNGGVDAVAFSRGAWMKF